jgi:HAD superfamily hydrolase (TIGR01509 family)
MDLFRRRLTPLMYETVTSLHKQGTRMCVASGSPRNRVSLCLEVAKMAPYFSEDSVFTREQVQRSKPAPDLFLYAAERMGTPPSSCIVVEDSTAGIEAALAAGMEVIGFLGGGHTSAAWYREAVRRFAVPVVETQAEVLALINQRLCSI